MKITWYGHCCFLLNHHEVDILTDPYDNFLNIELGHIESDIMTVSSIWHDHGNIAASPHAHIYAYEGTYSRNGVIITGIKSQEARGSSNIIYNIQVEANSVTNFADWGEQDSIKNFTDKETEILSETDIAFVRANAIDDDEQQFFYDLAFTVSHPKVIIPCHYFPESFIRKEIPEDEQDGYLKKLDQIDKMANRLGYSKKINEGYELVPDFDQNTDPVMVVFNEIHPQVRYVEQD